MVKFLPHVVRTIAAAATLLLLSWPAEPGSGPLAASIESAPAISLSPGAIVNVSTEPELQSAVAAVTSDTTIVIAAGTYNLTSTLNVNGAFTNVVIRGATENPSDVVLVGRGMSTANFGTVPNGIVIGGNVHGVAIANLTIRDVFYHAMVFGTGTQAPRVQNVRLIDAGQQFIKTQPDGKGGGVNDGIVEHSLIEYTSAARDSHTGGIEVVAGSGWIVRRNMFRNIKAPAGQLAGPAVLVWQGSRDSVVEGNAFINCQREIALGLEERTPNDHEGGIIRNNIIYRDATIQGNAAIHVADSPHTQVLHNTILASGSYPSPIEYRFADAAGVVIRNNLLDGPIAARDGASGTPADNYTTAAPTLFVNAAAGDLHLTPGATAVIDRVPAIMDAPTDFDGEPRPYGAAADYGADEYTAAAPPASSQASTTTASTTTAPAESTSTTSTTAATPADGLPAPWQSSDVGNPQVAGGATWSSGAFTVKGAGSDIGGNADQFRFVYQMLEGDGEIVARVSSFQNTSPSAKAGVMIRDELTADAKYAAALVTPENGLLFQYRIASGATTTQKSGGSGKAPQWLKVTRTGDLFRAFRSADGAVWTQIGSEVVYVNRLAYVGLVVTSRVAETLTTAIFTDTIVSGPSEDAQGSYTSMTAASDGASPSTSEAMTATFTSSSLAVSLTSPANNASFVGPATITLEATATDANGSDAVLGILSHWRLDEGSGTAVQDSAGPNSGTLPNGGTWIGGVKGGALRLNGSSQYVALPNMNVSGSALTISAWVNHAAFVSGVQQRIIAKANGSDSERHYWVLSHTNETGPNRLRFRIRADGSTTTLVASSGDLPVNTWYHAAATYDGSRMRLYLNGVEVGSRSKSGNLATSSSIPVHIGRHPGGSNYLNGAVDDVRIYNRALSPADIQAVMNGGSVAAVDFYDGTTLIGTSTSSPYRATWSNVPAGNYTLAAVARAGSGATATSASVSITVAANQPPAVSLTAPTDGAAFTAPANLTVTASASDLDGSVAGVDFYAGSTLIGSSTASPYSVTWSSVPAGSYTLTAVARDNAGASTTSAPATITVASTATPPTVSLTSPANNASFGAPATITLTATASDANGSDALPGIFSHWRLDEESGTVAQDSAGANSGKLPNGGTWTTGPKGGALRLNGSSQYIALPNMNVTGSALTISAWVYHAALPSGIQQRVISKASGTSEDSHYWMLGHTNETGRDRLRFRLRAGGSTATLIASSGDLPLNTWYHAIATYDGSRMRLYLNGVEVGSRSKSGTLATSSSVAVNIGRNPGGSHYLNGAVDDVRVYNRALTPADIHAVMNGGSVAAVDFYSGTTLIGTSTSSPYTATWSNVPAGNYPLTAVARASSGATATSDPVAITVAPNQPPVVSLTAPADGATFTTPANITLSASAIDSDGTVARVDFYAGSTLIGSATTSPYSITWQEAAAGVHTIVAVARDNSGATTTSAGVNVTVKLYRPPAVSLTAPANGATFTAPASITVSASASDPDGSVARVDFYAGTTLIGSRTATPYSISWSSVPAGSYSLTAVARDNNEGASATSAAVSITVGPSTTTLPHSVAFNASTDHSTNVTSYMVEFFQAGADPATATPVQTQNVGKPTPVNGEIIVDVSATIQALPAGTYFTTVVAAGSGGTSRSAPSETFVR